MDRSGSRLVLAGGADARCSALPPRSGDTMLHRTAVTNWITAAARVQQLLARKTAELGSVLTRRVAAGEVVAVSTGDVEKIGWFVEALARFAAAAATVVAGRVGLLFYQPALGLVVAVGVPVLALAVLPLLPAPPGAPTSSGRRPAGPPSWPPTPSPDCACCAASAARSCSSTATARASQEVRQAAVRSARMWALIAALQVLLPGLLLVAVVWYGVRLALDGPDRGRRAGHRRTARSAFLLFPLRTSRRSRWRAPSPGPSAQAGRAGAVAASATDDDATGTGARPAARAAICTTR